jgi:drug/metabolite transporter (DMT)-like permease
MHKKFFLGIVFCLMAVVSWGGMFPIMTSALTVMNPFLFTALRYTAAAALFLLVLYGKEGVTAFRLEGRTLVLWALGSLGFAGFGFFVFLGQKMTGASGAISASVIMALMPLLSVVLNWAFRKVKPLKLSLCFVLLSFVGVTCVATKGDLTSILSLTEDVRADLLILLGALCWVIYTMAASFFPGWSALRYTALTTTLGLTTIWTVNVALHLVGLNPVPTADSLLQVLPHLAYMALVAGFVGVLAWNAGNKILNPINGVLFMDVVPVTTFLISALAGHLFTRGELIGAGITVTALILNNAYQRLASRWATRVVGARRESPVGETPGGVRPVAFAPAVARTVA